MTGDFFDTYPDRPGYKARETSRDAAEVMAPKAKTLRDRAMACLVAHEATSILPAGLTADETAELMNESILSIRPRMSELAAKGLIYDTGIRRKNASKHPAIVWRAA